MNFNETSVGGVFLFGSVNIWSPSGNGRGVQTEEWKEKMWETWEIKWRNEQQESKGDTNWIRDKWRLHRLLSSDCGWEQTTTKATRLPLIPQLNTSWLEKKPMDNYIDRCRLAESRADTLRGVISWHQTHPEEVGPEIQTTLPWWL